MISNVITRYHPMMGVDLHMAQPTFPMPPPPVPRTPHVVGAVVHFAAWWMAGAKDNGDVQTPYGTAMSKIYDIGMLIPHIGANHPLLMLLWTLASGSQGHFGVSSVIAGKGPIAAALWGCSGPQLDCNEPCPLPTSAVFAPNTVVAGMTVGDVVAGVISAAITSAFVYATGKAVGRGGKAFGIADDSLASSVGSLLVGVTAGSPLGYSASTSTPLPVAVLTSPLLSLYDAPFASILDRLPGEDPDSPGHGIQSLSDFLGHLPGDYLGADSYLEDTSLPPPFPLGPLVPVGGP